MEHAAKIYNNIKFIVFSIFNRDGVENAYASLNANKHKLSYPAWIGLKAELDFYSQYRKKYKLDLSLDAGNKCDFIGNIEGCNNCRIDVTTNINFKKLEDYELIQKRDERMYKIVVMDKENGEILDIVDMNFPYDNSGGRLFDIAVFMPQSYNSQGDARYDYWQRIVTVGSSNPAFDYAEKSIQTDWYFPDIHTCLSEQDEADINGDGLQEYLWDAARFLSKATEHNIVACAQARHRYNPMTDEEDIVTQIYWKHPVIKNYLEDIIEEEI